MRAGSVDRQSILLTSPTGSGKTLAGFLGVFDFLLRKIDNTESMMLEDPSAALERIYHEMFARVETVTATPAPA